MSDVTTWASIRSHSIEMELAIQLHGYVTEKYSVAVYKIPIDSVFWLCLNMKCIPLLIAQLRVMLSRLTKTINFSNNELETE